MSVPVSTCQYVLVRVSKCQYVSVRVSTCQSSKVTMGHSFWSLVSIYHIFQSTQSNLSQLSQFNQPVNDHESRLSKISDKLATPLYQKSPWSLSTTTSALGLKSSVMFYVSKT